MGVFKLFERFLGAVKEFDGEEERLRSLGICVRCGEEPAAQDDPMCVECRLHDMSGP